MGHGLLSAVAALVERRRTGARALVAAAGLWSPGSGLVVRVLCCSRARGIFPDQESNPCLLHRQADSLPLRHWGSPVFNF